MKQFRELKKILDNGDSFLLIAHEEPDGDAIGAMISFGKYLKSIGKKADMVSKDTVPHFFSFLINGETIASDFLSGDYDAIILIDNGDLKRTGFAERITKAKKKGKLIINIDHHIQNDIWKIADLNIAKTNYSSSCEIIYEIFKEFDYPIDSGTATSLLAGIYYDTGGFQHSNTTKNVLQITSKLLQQGARLKKISKNVGQMRSVNMLKLWGIALNRIRVLNEYGIVYSVLTLEDIKKTGAKEDEISGLVNLINSTAEAKASLLIYESENDTIKGSLRTESEKIDVSRLAKMFGGGGHKKASGFLLSGKIVNTSYGWKIE